ncbi:MAG TPA: undecaprenyl-diphosphate phosphatase [Dinghuibacter sp.]|jgi:undecaprenyl-diphosphatase|uniref:undecaprenyl-diphosphate phosphatase n=1 Tax=Dinghuibacter sp. TaxID=2024697 RepID=UPI002C7FF083|nr:undecaprenyl-diphosphate phosphatase [Dinghuibacter sp.]HTJ13511.1 undecaprenyl-diphosphate phosphatase [Dinghuibacter sp.]
MSILHVIILAIVEGLTEFLPVSSTGHMIVTSSILGLPKTDFLELFEICIQLGAILAVVVLYWKKFFDFARWRFYGKLIVAVIPALVLGIIFAHKIKELLKEPAVVGVTFLLGGIVLLFIDNVFKRPTIEDEENITYTKAFVIGIWQCLAMIPGVSRSAASIIGGMQQKLTRQVAAEFSFFLAVPTMVAATAKDLLDYHKAHGLLESSEIKLLALGNVIAFVVAILAMKFFVDYLKKHGFRLFGYYRILAGIIVLLLVWKGIIQ